MFALLATLTAWAQKPISNMACVSCCQNQGLLTCPTRLRVFGDGSIAHREAGGWRVIGVWWLDCEEGASFQAGGTVVIPFEPQPGEVLLSGYPPNMVPCFSDHCALPLGACLSPGNSPSRYKLNRCGDGAPLSETAMRTPASAPPSK